MSSTVDLAQLDELRAHGAVVVDVLPEATYTEVHLPGAINIPLTRMDQRRVADLDRSRPIVVYCFDHQCDLSPTRQPDSRTSGSLRCTTSRPVAPRGRATAVRRRGAIGDRDRIGPLVRADVPRGAPDATVGEARKTIGEWELFVVTDANDVVLGIVRADVLHGQPDELAVDALLVPGPGTVRPDPHVPDMAQQLRRDHLEHVLVTTFSGHLLGLLRRTDLDVYR